MESRQLIILAVIVFFYATYFTKQILLHMHGISANRLARGIKPVRTRRIEALLLAFTYGTAAVQFLSVFASSHLLPLPLPVWARVTGAVVAIAGNAIFLNAVTEMKDSWRAGVDAGQDTALVTQGIYRYSRNPAFVGFDLLYTGTFLALPNVAMLVSGLVTILLLHLQILEEEKYLRLTLGEPYEQYRQRTPRYLLFL